MQYLKTYRISYISIFLFTTTLGHGCGEEPELNLGLLEQPIVNGVEDTGHPTVGRIAGGAEGHCTATLIGPKTVLTAAHCLTKKGPGFIVFPISVSFSGGLSTYSAASAVVHPTYGSYYYKGDVGIVRLKEVVQGLNPSPLTNAAPKIGQKAVLVGFGITATGSWGTSGVKRMAGNTIAYMTADNITFSGSAGINGNLCSGDSGGPSFIKQGGKDVVIGVHSTGSVPCGMSGNDIRVDLYRDWIIKEAKGDVGSTKDGVPPTIYITSPTEYEAVDTSFEVKVSAADNVGVTRVVIQVDGALAGESKKAPFTIRLTNVKSGSRTLKATAYDGVGNAAKDTVDVIVSTAGAKAAMGQVCVSNGDCTTGMCVDYPANTGRICTDTCDPKASKCPAGTVCVKAGGQDLCLPATSETEEPADRSGCTVGGGAGGWGVFLLLVGLALRRRRR